jgi:hypothetical protein
MQKSISSGLPYRLLQFDHLVPPSGQEMSDFPISTNVASFEAEHLHEALKAKLGQDLHITGAQVSSHRGVNRIITGMGLGTCWHPTAMANAVRQVCSHASACGCQEVCGS